jgi:NitT/TauT family transport system substrate-binding protein
VTHFIDEQMKDEGLFEPVRFQEFRSISDALLSDNLQATFMLAPLAMKLRESGKLVRIVYLGHRDGTALMVHKDSDIRRIQDLKGKTVAIPSRYSNQYLILFKALEERGMSINDINTVEMPPPMMPAALAARKGCDAIIAGEPIMARTELPDENGKPGCGRLLFMTKDVWPEFISCVLVVREDAIRYRRDEVQRLVDGIARSGLWLDSDLDSVNRAPGSVAAGLIGSQSANPLTALVTAECVKSLPPSGEPFAHRMLAADFVSKHYYNYPPHLLRYSLSTPRDRVKYTNLAVHRANFLEIEKYAKKAGIFEGKVTFDDYTDTSFVPVGRELKPWNYEGGK